MTVADNSNIIAAIDIGSSKIAVLIVAQNEQDELQVIGHSHIESKGIMNGFVSDIKAATKAIKAAYDQAERISETNLDGVWIGFSAGSLSSKITRRTKIIGGEKVTLAMVETLTASEEISIDEANNKVQLHAEPMLYIVDGLEEVKDPIGLYAHELGVEVHCVTADLSPVKNIEQAIRQASLHSNGLVVAPVATGLACLLEEERELGVALVEIGADMCNISIYAGGRLLGLRSFFSGGNDITDNIARSFAMQRSWAERQKCVNGQANSSPKDGREMIEVIPIGGEESSQNQNITKAELTSVIQASLESLAKEIEANLRELGFLGSKDNQTIKQPIVLTGGTAELSGLADYLQNKLGLMVRVASPIKLEKLPESMAGPGFSSLIGLVLYAARHLQKEKLPTQSQPKKGFVNWMRHIFD